MPTSKVTRVRRLGFSKIIASVLPASSGWRWPALSSRLRRRGEVQDLVELGAGQVASSVRKSRFMRDSIRSRIVERLVDLGGA